MSDPEAITSPLVDEVRRIRADIVRQCGHDLDKLAEALRDTEQEYVEGKGIFASVTDEAAARVVASWGELSAPVEDDAVAIVRGVRQRLGQER